MRRKARPTNKINVDAKRHVNIVKRSHLRPPGNHEEPKVYNPKPIENNPDHRQYQGDDGKNYRVELIERHPKLVRGYKKIGKIEPIYLGETIYIVGGGPSLKDFDFSSLKDKITIVVNKSFRHVPNPNAMYWSDTRLYGWFQEEIDAMNCLKVTNKPFPANAPGVTNLLNTGKHGLERDPRCIRDGGNSGYAAINLAYHLGAKKIVLLGFDMKVDKSLSHYHGGYNQLTKIPDDALYKRLMLPSFDTIAQDLAQAKVKVYNANLQSAIECFPKITLAEIFSI